MDKYTQSGLMDYHNHVLRDLSDALEELDEALARRRDEADELRELIKRS